MSGGGSKQLLLLGIPRNKHFFDASIFSDYLGGQPNTCIELIKWLYGANNGIKKP